VLTSLVIQVVPIQSARFRPASDGLPEHSGHSADFLVLAAPFF